VGGLITKKCQVIMAGCNQHLPVNDQQYKNSDPRISYTSGIGADFSSSIHAEANLIALAAKKGIALDGAEIFVTTFPCPVCAKQIAVSGIKKVYYAKGYAVLDGLEILKAFGVEVVLVQFSKEEFIEIEKMEQERSIVKDCYTLI
jgi:dCMP deaminase